VTIDGTATSELASYIKRELRSLGDVEIRSNYVRFVITIVSDQMQGSASGRTMGYCLAVCFITPQPDGHNDFEGLMTCYGPSVERLAKEIVIRFDTDILEKARQSSLEAKKQVVLPVLDIRPQTNQNNIIPGEKTNSSISKQSVLTPQK
jgi:hypothetical protein